MKLAARPSLSVHTGHSAVPDATSEKFLQFDKQGKLPQPLSMQVTKIQDELDGPRAPGECSETEEEDFDDSCLSAILRNAMIESPREHEICHWNLGSKSRSNSQDRFIPLTDSLRLTTSTEGDCLTPGGSKKVVKFSHAKVLDTTDTHSDYFSLSESE